jgi:hypothetical protein
MGTELFHVDRRTDMTKLTVVFRNFAKAPKKRCAGKKYYCQVKSKYPQLSSEMTDLSQPEEAESAEKRSEFNPQFVNKK